jgi:hypothetical protein
MAEEMRVLGDELLTVEVDPLAGVEDDIQHGSLYQSIVQERHQNLKIIRYL